MWRFETDIWSMSQFQLHFGELLLIHRQAAANLKKIRDDICLALVEIPHVLDQANNKLNMFSEHKLQEDSPLFQYGHNLLCSVSVYQFAKSHPPISTRANSCPQ